MCVYTAWYTDTTQLGMCKCDELLLTYTYMIVVQGFIFSSSEQHWEPGYGGVSAIVNAGHDHRHHEGDVEVPRVAQSLRAPLLV